MSEAHVEAHVDLASSPQEIPASAPTEAIIDMLKERGALSAIVLAQLPTGGPAEGDFLASQIGINGNYLLAALRQVPGEVITLRGEDPGSPVVVSSAEQSAGDIIILMPLRV